MPTVSVIMGIYNCEDTLGDSLQSIIDQTYTDWELILCDDCSTDNTYNIAEQFAKKHDNIILLKNDRNMKLAYTLNKCLGFAKGKYIARADGDDICLKERFQIQVDFLNKNPQYTVVGSSVILYDERGDRAVREFIEYPNKFTLIKTTPFAHPTIMMHKTTYEALGGYTVSDRTIRGQDADLWFRFFARGFKGYNIQRPLCKYHASLSDYKKRTFKSQWNSIKTRFIGYKRLGFPLKYYLHLLKPLIVALLPNKLVRFYRKKIRGIEL